MSESSDLSSHFSVIHTPTFTNRLIEISHGELDYQLNVSSTSHYHAARSRDRYLASLESSDDPSPSSLIELIARFLLFVIDHEDLWVEASSTAHSEFIGNLLNKLEEDFLRGANIHTVTKRVPGNSEQRQSIIKSYYKAMAFTGRSPAEHTTALLESITGDESTNVYAIFGGQGNTTDYFSELRILHSTYTQFVEPVIDASIEVMQSLMAHASVTTLRQFSQGLNVAEWLRRPDTTPASEYLLSAPVSFPLIGILQFANYAVMCRVLGKTPGQVLQHIKGMTGHSQGIVVAAALATAKDWETFDDALKTALTILFWIGSRSQETTPSVTVPSKISLEAIDNGEGFPTPMLNVSNCTQAEVQKFINNVNKHLEPHQQISIGLINGRSNIVVSGPVLSLCALNTNLRKLKAGVGLNQDKVVFSARKPDFSSRYLPISAPFHTKHLRDAAGQCLLDLKNVSIPSNSLKTSVYHSTTGEDLQNSTITNLVPDLVKMITCELDDWPKSTKFPGATHILEFGPGGISGVGPLTHRNKEGTGVRVILMSANEGTSCEYGYRSELFERNIDHLVRGINWLHAHGPRLVKTSRGELQIENAMTKLLGLPPIMVAGMTPTTVSWEFVSAIINAGYHVELAGGGFNNADQMAAAIKKVQSSIPSGRGICLNVIYASPKSIRWQMPMIQKLRSEGVPIDGITFGAGVPSVEVANEYIQTLNLRYMAFKPGSANSINQTIAIAKANPQYPIVLQWTGGRGGGHHSYEDFHDPILKLYGRIRRCSNIVLLAGSGFGGAEDTYPYISGNWSIALGYPAMPFDGCLFGSRMMVAKEAKTSKAAKEAIVAAPGVEDPLSWELTYKSPAGGIVTVKSEMGEPIHKIATRGVLLWREMDDKIFSISDKAKRLAELQKLRPYIIKRLNDDFQKVWFGHDSSGRTVDLQDMTYAEVLQRLVELLYVKAEARWIDPSYIRLTAEFVRRMFSRLCSAGTVPKFEINFGLQMPFMAVKAILAACPKAHKQVITYDDARYFILLCKRPGQKPVTFVPELDDDFEVWFKKDSLWQSEDLAAVVGQDPQRTCILQGPVAARFATKVNEPVAEILDNINDAHVAQLLKDNYGGKELDVPPMSFGKHPTSGSVDCPPLCHITRESGKTHYRIDQSATEDQLPSASKWLQLLAGPAGTWRHALLTSEDIFQGTKVRSNPIQRILSPHANMHIEISNEDEPENTTIAILEDSSDKNASSKLTVLVRKSNEILVTFFTDETVERINLPLTFKFTYHPEYVLHPIREVMLGRNERLRNFYYRLWFGTGQQAFTPKKPQRVRTRSFETALQKIQTRARARGPIAVNTKVVPNSGSELETPLDLHNAAFNISSPTTAVFHGREVTVSSPSINDFTESIEQSSKGISSRSDKTMASLDFAIVVGWEAMMKAIFPRAIDGEFLNLVHLSNKFNVLNDSAPLSSLDTIESTAEILSITNEPAGRVVEVGAIIRRDDEPVLELVSEFLFRGSYTNFDVCFQKKREKQMEVLLDTPAKVAVLRSKSWMSFVESNAQLLGQTLIFQLDTLNRFESSTTLRSATTIGQVFIRPVSTKSYKLVGTIHYQAGKSSSNPVVDYLARNGKLSVETHELANPQPLGEEDWLRITAPSSNHAYARASGDFNPIHVSRPFAKYANLPGTITHGMYTSAAVRGLVEKAAGSNEEVRMRSYKASFVSMVLPGDELEIQVTHTAMRNGLRVLSFQAVNVRTGDKVITGEAEVDQPLSTYIFTGQGSQVPDMGMELYASSEVAKGVWDSADRYFSETYGFLISDIVKRNPKEMTVHFGGRRGFKIRQHYMDMKVIGDDGAEEKFFKTIDETTTSYTFRHERGLLFSTEFAQPALTIMERAQYYHLDSKSLISNSALFAGHSLGEYSALSTIGDIMSLEELLSVVFYRGLTMQAAVERDASGQSKFAMVAVNPSRISKTLTTEKLQRLVELVRNATNDLLEVVNYNVDGQQYVCAGSLTSLDCLADVTNYIAANPSKVSFSDNSIPALVTECAAQVALKPQPIVLKRGSATIPLEGIDVPFHSSFLLPKMPAFRNLLLRHIAVEAIDPSRLIGKYVSNVTGKPFGITKEHFKDVYETTKSVVLSEIIEAMEDDD